MMTKENPEMLLDITHTGRNPLILLSLKKAKKVQKKIRLKGEVLSYC
jgi:hypothetical protein